MNCHNVYLSEYSDMVHIARRMAGFQESAIRAMTARCKEVGGVNLGQGLCQVDPPPSLLEHGRTHFKTSSHSYSPAQGDPGLLETIAAKVRRYNDAEIDPDSQVVATIGATGGVLATLVAFLNPGDGVLVVEPFYGYHLSAIRLLELAAEPVRTCPPSFGLDDQALREAVSDRTRAIIVCTPGNPAGRRLTLEELGCVARLAVEHDL